MIAWAKRNPDTFYPAWAALLMNDDGPLPIDEQRETELKALLGLMDTTASVALSL